MVAELLKNHANIEAQDEQHCTPLHLACKKGSQDCVELILRNGGNIYALDHRQWTPLHYGAYNGHPRAVNYLVKTEADGDKLPDMMNSQARTAFIIAKDDRVKKAFNHIWKACKDGDLDMVRILYREDEEILNAKTVEKGNTPLHIASKNGHYLIAKFLTELGCRTDLENNEGRKALEVCQE